MRDEEAVQRAADLRRRILGDEDPEVVAGPTAGWVSDLVDAETEHFWAVQWQRGELDTRSRMISTLSLLVALGNKEEFARYLRGALRTGLLSKAEVRELILHIGSYIGYPRTKVLGRIAQNVLAETEVPS